MEKQNKPTSVGICDSKNTRIVHTIFEQIKYPNKIVFGSWGAKGFTMAQSNDEFKEPCLMFKVNGMKFKGYVHIFYNWADYYRVEFVSTHRNLKNVVDMVFADNLQSVIDEYVEKVDEYAF